MTAERRLVDHLNGRMRKAVSRSEGLDVASLENRLSEMIPKFLRNFPDDSVETEGGRTIPLRRVKVKIKEFGDDRLLVELRMRGETVEWTIPCSPSEDSP